MRSDRFGNLNKSRCWIGCTMTDSGKENPFGWFAAFLSFVRIVQQCTAGAAGLQRGAAGAVDLAPIPGALQGLHAGPGLIWSCGLRSLALRDALGAGLFSPERGGIQMVFAEAALRCGLQCAERSLLVLFVPKALPGFQAKRPRHLFGACLRTQASVALHV